nr:FG-GAP-like repeat-containing protein [Streptomyces sp. SID8379]
MTLAPAATARPAPLHGDFNGDGFTDLAVGLPAANVSGHTGAGYVNVVWGGPGGLGARGSSTYSQNSAGIPGTSESGDHFGYAVSPADLNGDGYADLAVSAPDETLDTPGESREGALYVLWGSAKGLTSGTTTAKGHDEAHIGRLLNTGDYDHDGHGDLAYSSNGEETAALRLRPGPQTSAAASTVIRNWHFAGPSALATADFDGDGGDDLAVTYSGMEDQGTFVTSKPATGDWTTSWTTGDHGAALAAGDFDGDGTQDLAIGLVEPNPEVEETYCPKDRTGGAVALISGAAGTTLGGDWDCTTQDSPYVGGTGEPEDDFGAALATVHAGSPDGSDALLVGIPHETVGTKERAAGAYAFLETVYREPVLEGPLVTQNSAQVAGTSEFNDRFGSALAAADHDGDGYPDLAVGAPGENGSTGGVWFKKGAEKPALTDTVSVTPKKLGLSGAVGHGTVLGH